MLEYSVVLFMKLSHILNGLRLYIFIYEFQNSYISPELAVEILEAHRILGYSPGRDSDAFRE